MKTTLQLSIRVISARLLRTWNRPCEGNSPALASRERSAALLLFLLGAGLAGIARGQVVTEFLIPTADSVPYGIAAGPDGSLWFTEAMGYKIGRITTAGVITEFPIPTNAVSITAGSDGSLWFTGFKIGRITTAGVLMEFPIPTADSGPDGIAAGPDGNLWFTEFAANQIGRITTAGVITEFPIPANRGPGGIAAGPDGNLWFTEFAANQIGRITTAGVITEFPVPTAAARPDGITQGPDGNLWFTERAANQIARITVAGVVTEFPIPAAGASPSAITAGLDGNLWFTEYYGNNNIGRITPAGIVTEFPIPTADSVPLGIAAGPDGSLWFIEAMGNKIGRITTGPTTPQQMTVDGRSVTGSISNANGVLEADETVQVAPSWKNTLTDSQAFTGTASNLAGPVGPTYAIDDGSADYGTVSAGATEDCQGATTDCYLMTVSGARPTAHWDATFTETLSANSISKVWKLHVGNSFTDVSTDIAIDPYYPSIETIFHKGVTAGCLDGTVFCPTADNLRREMAVFLLKASQGASFTPPAATGIFGDVPATDPYAPWIENLYGRGITSGCQLPGDSLAYCPDRDILRREMAIFLLKTLVGSAYTPPDPIGIFSDVPVDDPYAPWIEDIYNRGITAGCSSDPGPPPTIQFCPDALVLRQEMAVFLTKTFGLTLYGP